MRLIRVEIKRLLARRLFKGLTLLAFVGFAIGGTIAFIASDNSPEAIAAARSQRAIAIRSCLERVQQDATLQSEEFPPDARANPQGFCEDETYGDSPAFPYRDFTWMLRGLGMPLVMLGWLLGASAIGAEWANRTMTTTLTWESRRGRVLGAKILAGGLVSFAWIFLLSLLFAAAMYPAGRFEGSMVGVDLSWWLGLARIALSISAVAAIASALAASIATVGRHTAAALGAGFVYLAVVESLVRAYRPGWVDWLIGDNAALVMVGPEEVTHLSHSQAAALLLLLAYAGVFFLGALKIFGKRDLA